MDRNRDYEYYVRRARDERHKASACEDNAVALAHFRLADAYDQRVLDLETSGYRASSSTIQDLRPVIGRG